MKTSLRAALLATAVAAVAPVASQAATLAFGTMPTAVAANPAVVATTGTVNQNATGSVSSVQYDAWKGTDLAGSPYVNVLGGSSITYATGLANALSFVWGSPDRYNTVEFLLNNQVVDTMIGTFGSNQSNYFVTLSDIAGGLFDSVRFSSGDNAFELANVSVAAVPVPAAGLMLLTAFGGVAALRRRKTA